MDGAFSNLIWNDTKILGNHERPKSAKPQKRPFTKQGQDCQNSNFHPKYEDPFGSLWLDWPSWQR